MKKGIKRRWIRALRSGRYKQARRKLRGDNGYCCLGVLCDISGKGNWRELNTGCWVYDYRGLSSSAYPCEEIRKSIGLRSVEMEELISMNDSEKTNFDTIADWIENRIEDE